MKRSHILVADDEENMLNTLEFILEAADYQVSTATDGQQALQTILKSRKNNHPVDLLVTDIQMPKLTGLELIERLKNLELDIPVLVITGYGNRQMIIDLMRIGCSDYLDKPIDEEEFLQRVGSLVGKKN